MGVSTLGLVALEACLEPDAVREAEAQARSLDDERGRLTEELKSIGVQVALGSRAPFLLCRVPGRPDVREALRERGIAVRRGDTFPGLTGEHWRTAVRDRQASEQLLSAVASVVLASPSR